jgi:hypothetical protein
VKQTRRPNSLVKQQHEAVFTPHHFHGDLYFLTVAPSTSCAEDFGLSALFTYPCVQDFLQTLLKNSTADQSGTGHAHSIGFKNKRFPNTSGDSNKWSGNRQNSTWLDMIRLAILRARPGSNGQTVRQRLRNT